MNIYEKATRDADVMVAGHVVLGSGRHSGTKLEFDRLIDHQRELHTVLGGLKNLIHDTGAELVVPVPRGALELYQRLPHEMPVLFTDKRDRRDFVIPKAYHQQIRRAGRIAVGEDVVTTGGTPAAMADAILDINSSAQLHLVGIWRRDEMTPASARRFKSARFLVEQYIPSWPAQQCPDSSCSAAATA